MQAAVMPGVFMSYRPHAVVTRLANGITAWGLMIWHVSRCSFVILWVRSRELGRWNMVVEEKGAGNNPYLACTFQWSRFVCNICFQVLLSGVTIYKRLFGPRIDRVLVDVCSVWNIAQLMQMFQRGGRQLFLLIYYKELRCLERFVIQILNSLRREKGYFHFPGSCHPSDIQCRTLCACRRPGTELLQAQGTVALGECGHQDQNRTNPRPQSDTLPVLQSAAYPFASPIKPHPERDILLFL